MEKAGTIKVPRTYLEDYDSLAQRVLAVTCSGKHNEKLVKRAKAMIRRIDRTVAVLDSLRLMLSMYVKAWNKSKVVKQKAGGVSEKGGA